MGVQSSKGQVMFSSIALLQQRFREPERIREKREERLLHVLAPPPPCGHVLPEGDAREVVLPPGAALPVQAAA
ncbi:unnamed protein product [Miscanthus lutarioriparius]|uniref:Uncharacterized protein n=1 Tax=Miscanthus lutarioriparius TaxID=422564 RepID=A0A811P556_9POAL|nr:unnamed protein product [Miscanthus lutarioriparius]